MIPSYLIDIVSLKKVILKMASTQLELLGENIDLVFFVFAAAIFLIELAELGFKGKFNRAKVTEMLASASTQIPYLLIESFLMTGLCSLFYVLAYSSIPWMWDISWTTALLAILAADFAYIGNIELHIALGYCGHSTPFTIHRKITISSQL